MLGYQLVTIKIKNETRAYLWLHTSPQQLKNKPSFLTDQDIDTLAYLIINDESFKQPAKLILANTLRKMNINNGKVLLITY